MTQSMADIQVAIIHELDQHHDWMKKYEYLIALGKSHIVDTQSLHLQKYAIPGCQSNAWLKVIQKNGILEFEADSESVILRGIIVLLLRVYNHQTPKDIAETPPYFLEKSGLSLRLSPSKANGIQVIIQNIRQAGSRC